MVLNSLSFCLSVKLLKVMATSFKRSHACTATLCAPNPAVPTGDSWTLLRKPGSDSCGVTTPFSWVLVCTRFCLHPPRVYFPFLCKFWQLWLMATSSKRAYAIPKSASPRAPAPVSVHWWLVPPKEMLWKCCTKYVSKSGKLSSGHRTGNGQLSFQSQKKAMSKNAQTTAHCSHLTC